MRKHIKTVNKAILNKTLKTGGCGECPASCQSACKTSCTVGNQVCEQRIIFMKSARKLMLTKFRIIVRMKQPI